MRFNITMKINMTMQVACSMSSLDLLVPELDEFEFEIVGTSRYAVALKKQVDQAAMTETPWKPVLICGEHGLHKKSIARLLYNKSGSKAMKIFNCAMYVCIANY